MACAFDWQAVKFDDRQSKPPLPVATHECMIPNRALSTARGPQGTHMQRQLECAVALPSLFTLTTTGATGTPEELQQRCAFLSYSTSTLARLGPRQRSAVHRPVLATTSSLGRHAVSKGSGALHKLRVRQQRDVERLRKGQPVASRVHGRPAVLVLVDREHDGTETAVKLGAVNYLWRGKGGITTSTAFHV